MPLPGPKWWKWREFVLWAMIHDNFKWSDTEHPCIWIAKAVRSKLYFYLTICSSKFGKHYIFFQSNNSTNCFSTPMPPSVVSVAKLPLRWVLLLVLSAKCKCKCSATVSWAFANCVLSSTQNNHTIQLSFPTEKKTFFHSIIRSVWVVVA